MNIQYDTVLQRTREMKEANYYLKLDRAKFLRHEIGQKEYLKSVAKAVEAERLLNKATTEFLEQLEEAA